MRSRRAPDERQCLLCLCVGVRGSIDTGRAPGAVGARSWREYFDARARVRRSLLTSWRQRLASLTGLRQIQMLLLECGLCDISDLPICFTGGSPLEPADHLLAHLRQRGLLRGKRRRSDLEVGARDQDSAVNRVKGSFFERDHGNDGGDE